MRVALFTDADVFAGTERHIFDLAHGLRAAGVTACIACPVPSPLAEKGTAAGFEIVPIAKGGLIDRPAIDTLKQRLYSGAIEIIHAHNGRTMLTSALAVQKANAGRSVATQHFLFPDHVTRTGPKAVIYHTAHRWVSRRTARFIAISEAVKREMLRRQDAPEAKITVVPNGIVTPNERALAAPEQVRKELGLASDVPLIVCAARLEREKDIASLIGAMAEVHSACPAAVCLIAGEGAQKELLQRQIVSAALEKTVRLLGFRSDVMALIRAADLFVLPSLAEPFGLVLLEAMALGKPVIATRAGGPMEIVVEGQTGLLTPPSDPTALARNIQHLLGEPNLLQTMGRNGRERFRERFTSERMGQAMRAVYEDALQQPRG